MKLLPDLFQKNLSYDEVSEISNNIFYTNAEQDKKSHITFQKCRTISRGPYTSVPSNKFWYPSMIKSTVSFSVKCMPLSNMPENAMLPSPGISNPLADLS